MAKDTMKNCKHCGQEIAVGAKTCPKCGGKNPKPIYKRVWFWIVVVIIVGGIGGAVSGGSDDTAKKDTAKVENQSKDTEKKEKEEITYTAYDVVDLFDELKGNALKAETDHQDEYVEIHGYLGTIDSDGKYICVGSDEKDYDHMFDEISCNINDDSQLDTILEMKKNDKIVVRGRISSIGEVLGYTIEIDEIEAEQ